MESTSDSLCSENSQYLRHSEPPKDGEESRRWNAREARSFAGAQDDNLFRDRWPRGTSTRRIVRPTGVSRTSRTPPPSSPWTLLRSCILRLLATTSRRFRRLRLSLFWRRALLGRCALTLRCFPAAPLPAAFLLLIVGLRGLLPCFGRFAAASRSARAFRLLGSFSGLCMLSVLGRLVSGGLDRIMAAVRATLPPLRVGSFAGDAENALR